MLVENSLPAVEEVGDFRGLLRRRRILRPVSHLLRTYTIYFLTIASNSGLISLSCPMPFLIIPFNFAMQSMFYIIVYHCLDICSSRQLRVLLTLHSSCLHQLNMNSQACLLKMMIIKNKVFWYYIRVIYIYTHINPAI